LHKLPFDTIEEIHIKKVFFKKEKWSNENEYRIAKMWLNYVTDDERKIILPDEAFKVLIIGSELNDIEKEEIKKITINNFPTIDLKLARKVNTEIQITPN